MHLQVRCVPGFLHVHDEPVHFQVTRPFVDEGTERALFFQSRVVVFHLYIGMLHLNVEPGPGTAGIALILVGCVDERFIGGRGMGHRVGPSGPGGNA